MQSALLSTPSSSILSDTLRSSVFAVATALASEALADNAIGQSDSPCAHIACTCANIRTLARPVAAARMLVAITIRPLRR